jgi:hypothetical protein
VEQGLLYVDARWMLLVKRTTDSFQNLVLVISVLRIRNSRGYGARPERFDVWSL